MSAKAADRCPCGSGLSLGCCCEPILQGQRPAATAVALMRSRYVAFVTHNLPYLLGSWHPSTRPGQLEFDSHQHWLGLKIVSTTAGTEHDQEGIVEFVARYKISGAGHRLHEISRFVRTNDRWLYLDGTILDGAILDGAILDGTIDHSGNRD